MNELDPHIIAAIEAIHEALAKGRITAEEARERLGFPPSLKEIEKFKCPICGEMKELFWFQKMVSVGECLDCYNKKLKPAIPR